MPEIASLPNLSAALVTAQSNARSVGKDKTNTFHKYAYASAEAIIDEARAALTSAGLALCSAGRRFAQLTAQGEKDPIGRVEITYRLVHTSGEAHEFTSSTFVIPEKGRPADKAESAAVTSDLAYTLRGLLLLPRDAEGGASVDGRDDTGYAPYASRDSAATSAPADPPPPTREDIRRAADAAAASQVKGPVGRVPTTPAEDPAWAAMAQDMKRRIADLVNAENPGDGFVRVYDEVKGAGLPEATLREVVSDLLVAVFNRAGAADDLDAWIPVAKKHFPGVAEGHPVKVAFNAAAQDLGWQPAPAQAA